MKICVKITKEFPSYLHDLFQDERMGTINLVYLNKSTGDENIHSTNTNFVMNETENEITLDVTGNPLEVDLHGDDTLVIEEGQIIQQWSESENQHFPMPIKEARNYLNSGAKNRTKDPVFTVCDGDNPLKTVILGVQESRNKIFTCTINILGCFPKNHEKVTLNLMEKSHLFLMGSKKCKIDYVVTFKYFIFGSFLQNIKDSHNTAQYGSICIETNVNKKCSLDKPGNVVDRMKVILQVIAGHRKSLVNFLWEDLVLICDYLKIMSSSNKEKLDVDICKDPLAIEDIYNSINEIVNTKLIKRELKVEYSLDNIRLPNIMDKLWNILKNCQNLRILRDAFHYFFEELAESTSNIKLSEGHTSNMATITNGILDGKLAVPTIDYSQALEFLIEIGAEKLKNDYQTIIKHFYVSSSKLISSKWNELESKLSVEETHRKTRITQFLKNNKVIIKNCTAKLGYLAKLHVATEMIYLVKSGAFLPEQTFDYFCERVCKYYMAEDCVVQEFKNVLENPLCNFNVVINSADTNIVEGKIPDFCSVRLISAIDGLEAQSVYLLSKYTIFPPNIYDNYDIVGEEIDTVYYACKLESRTVTV